MNEKFVILIRISLNFVPKCPIDKKLALVQVMTGRRTGDKPLSEPMLTQFTDSNMQHKGRWVNVIGLRGGTPSIVWGNSSVQFQNTEV